MISRDKLDEFTAMRCYQCDLRTENKHPSDDELRKAGWLTDHRIELANGSGTSVHLCPKCVSELGWLDRLRCWCLQGDHRLGSVTQLYFCNYGYCGRCKTTWNFCRSHSTAYCDWSGCFPLCELCWQELSIEERLPYYRRLWHSWMSCDGTETTEETWKLMEQAVRNGL